MADNEVRGKQPMWPWVAGILVLLIAAWVLFGVFDQDGITTVYEPGIDPEVVMSPEVREPVDSFLTFVAEKRAGEELPEGSQYLVSGINKLADALEAISKRDQIDVVDIDAKHSQLKSMTSYIQQDPMPEEHIDSIRNAFLLCVRWMEVLQHERYEHFRDDILLARESAEAIDPDVAIYEQTKEVQLFFNNSASVVRKMAYYTEEGRPPRPRG